MLFILPQGDEFYQTRCHYNWLLSPLPRIFCGHPVPRPVPSLERAGDGHDPVCGQLHYCLRRVCLRFRQQLCKYLSSDNFPLLSSACAVVRAIQERDYDTLAAFVHPEEGVTFTPYSTVDRDSDLRFTAAQVRQFSTDQTVYTWGVSDGLGSLIELTPAEYFSTYVFNTDYTQAPEIGVDRILQSGNALENLTEAYPGCRFVEFHFPGLDPANAGLDWCSLKLVFSPSDSCWQLVGIIHSQWTI